MRQSEELADIKRELRSYNFCKKRVKKLNELIDYCYHMLGGIKGRDLTKEPVHSPPNKDAEYKIREEITHHENNLRLTQARIDYVDLVLTKMEKNLANQVKMVYIDGKTLDYVARKHYMGKSTLEYRIDKGLERALHEL